MKPSTPLENQENLLPYRKQTLKKSLKGQILNGSITQTLLPSKKNSLRMIHDEKNNTVNDFYKTLGTTSSGEWARPESKRASRKQSNRPETSKGNRMLGSEKYFAHQDKLKSLLPSKSMHNCHKEKMITPVIDNGILDVEIIVNKRKPLKKQKSVYEDKFKTELP